MARELGKVTRISVIVTVLVALVMLATPVLQIGGKSVGPVGNAAAANGSRVFNIGVVDLTGGTSTLNPFTYTMSEEYDIFGPCYSYLLTRDVNAQEVGDLATSWSLAPDGVTWHFKLAQNAYFIDPAAPASTAHPVTAADVIWTYWEINNDSKNHLSSYFLTGTYGILDSMWTGTNQFDLYIKTKTPYAPMMGAFDGIPIVPKYIWEKVNPTGYKNLPPIGSGAFYCTVTKLPLSNVAILKRNTIWFQEVNKGWQVHVDTLQFKSESSTANAWTDLTTPALSPNIDVFLNVAPTQYKNNLAAPNHTDNVIGFAKSTGFMYEYQLNQLSLAQRTALGMHAGSNNQLLLNPTVKLAMAMLVDKPEFVKQVIMGFGTVADSLVPDCNPWHYDYPSPVQFDPVGARAMLMAAGWDHDVNGQYAGSSTWPLYKYGPSNHTVYQPLKFRMLTLTPDQEWILGSGLLSDWAKLGGVELDVQAESVNQANSDWYAGNYDTWLWDWVFTPSSDVSTDCLQVDTSMAIGTWSGSYWNNPVYDALYNRSLTIMDPVARRVLTDEMQAMIYEDHNDQLIAYTQYLYAASTINWNGYGDWAAHWTLMPDQGYPWLYMMISPVGNQAPTVYPNQASYPGEVGAPVLVSFGYGDPSTLKYQWYWGDGQVSGWQPSASQSHPYATDGVYTAYFAAQEQLGTPVGDPNNPPSTDGFVSWGQVTITVENKTNTAPHNPGIAMTPLGGINQGTSVNFTGNATDPNVGDLLYYSWNFGDTYTAVGQTAFHQFTTPGAYTVIMNVTDNHVGAGRPAVKTQLISVTVNHQPSLSIASSQSHFWKVPTWFNASASDQDTNDTLRFTWAWGDGSTLVTTSPLNVTHTYTQKGRYSMLVYADDKTGLPGHNVSGLDVVTIMGTPSPPASLSLSPPTVTIWTGQTVTFTAGAKDSTGDAMQFTINCGDGGYIVVNTPSTTNNKQVWVTAYHTYYSDGSYTAWLYVSDGQDNTTGTLVPAYVTANHNDPPVVTPQTNKTAWSGSSITFSVTATDPQEQSTLRFTWTFGDGFVVVINMPTTSTPHTYTKAGMYIFAVYVDDLTGISGHNVSSSATASAAFNLVLKQGWNLVTVPLVGKGYMASTIPGLVTGDVVASWNSTIKDYDHTYIKNVLPDDFAIQPNTGYWIWVATAKTLHLYGSLPTDWQARTIALSGAGWIMLGFESLNATRHAGDIVKMYAGTGTISMISAYNATSRAYTDYITVIDTTNFTLVPGQAYWCWFTAGGPVSGQLGYWP